jgi:hypothetical protein
MKKITLLLSLAFAMAAIAEEDNAIKVAMKYAHKAPQGQKKLNEKIIEGTATDAEITKALELYKAMADTKPPRGDQAAFKEKVAKVVAATQELVDKKSEGVAHYKEAINCKACHSDFKPPQK